MSDRDKSQSRERSGSNGDKPVADRDATTTSLLVRNLSYRVRADEIRRVFSRYGEIRDVYLPEVRIFSIYDKEKN